MDLAAQPQSPAVQTQREDKDRKGLVLDRRKRSLDWMKGNYYPQWEAVWRNYNCIRDPEQDPNSPNPIYGYDGRLVPLSKADKARSSVGMPDTWALNQRTVARITANIPNLHFRADDAEVAERVSRTLMYQWDKGGVQRLERKHALQASLFGWSVRAWYYENQSFNRIKRLNPLSQISPDDMDLVHQQYAQEIEQIGASELGLPQGQVLQTITSDPEQGPGMHQAMMALLTARYGRGKMLPVQYEFKGYAGPRTDWLFVGNCFPEPSFNSIQSSSWFIVSRRRNRKWLERLAKTYQQENPKLAANVEELLRDKANGDPKSMTGDSDHLMRNLLGLIEQESNGTWTAPDEGDAEWDIVECHTTGEDAAIWYCHESIYLGEVQYPYFLEGKVAFTEQLLIDSLLAGIGDSHSRIIRGLQWMHERSVNQRSDLVNNLLQPLVWTTNQRLYDQPELLRRAGGFRLVKTNSGNDIGVLGEQGALASAAAGLADESVYLRNIQMATGENNMSQAANVDPQQSRTATGARLLAYNQDILSRAAIEMHNLSVRDDAEMMYMLNRSEMSESLRFDAAPYIRAQSAGQPVPDSNFIEATPEDFQYDGHVESEIGSTLADDDDAKMARAREMNGMWSGNPNVNQDKLRDFTLISLGQGKHLQEWAPLPPPPPAPPELKVSTNVATKMEMLPPEVQQMILQRAGLLPQMGQPPGGGPPPEPPPQGSPSMPSEAMAPPDETMLGANATNAAMGVHG